MARGIDTRPLARYVPAKLHKLLNAFPTESAEALLSWGETAPTGAWLAYHRAVADVADAVGIAPPRFARPIVEQHFVHLFRHFIDDGSPKFSSLEIDDEVAATVARHIEEVDGSVLASLDKATNPMIPVLPIDTTDFGEALTTIIKPITYLQTVAGATAKLAPVIAAYAAESNADGSRIAAWLFRAAVSSGGIKTWESQKAVFKAAFMTGALSKAELDRATKDVFAEHLEEALGKPEEVLEKRLASSALWSGVQVLLALSGAMHLFTHNIEQPDLQKSDYIKALQAVGSATNVGIAAIAARYGTVWQDLGEEKIIWNITGNELNTWVKFASKEGAFLIGLAVSYWQTRTVVEEKRACGDESWRADVSSAMCGLVLTGVGMASPVAGLIIGVTMGIAEYFLKGTGPSGIGTKHVYDARWKTALAEIKRMKSVAAVDVEAPGFSLDDAFDEDKPLGKRIRALTILLGRDSYMDGAPAFFDLQKNPYAKRAMRNQGFTDDEIRLMGAGY